jgi:hypothetical protein
MLKQRSLLPLMVWASLTADWLAGPALRSGKLVEVLPGWTVKGDGGVYAAMPPAGLFRRRREHSSNFSPRT